jgi:hypothetical protein
MSQKSHVTDSGDGSVNKRADGRYSGFMTLEDLGRKYFSGKTQCEVERKIRAAQLAQAEEPERQLLDPNEKRVAGEHAPGLMQLLPSGDRQGSVRPGTPSVMGLCSLAG